MMSSIAASSQGRKSSRVSGRKRFVPNKSNTSVTLSKRPPSTFGVDKVDDQVKTDEIKVPNVGLT